ncbi:MAG: NERD domain-containing protein [Anaerolineae bacterium]|nr:NERD domain-containing protein [Anaerolineae bacterium]
MYNSDDAQLREASRTMAHYLLSQQEREAKNSPGPLHVISSDRRSFAERRQIQLTMLEGGILGVIFSLTILLIYLLFTGKLNGGITIGDINGVKSGILGVVLGLVILGLIGFLELFGLNKFFNLIMNRIEYKLDLHRKGQLGEQRALNVLQGVLDGNWWLFRNLELPGRRLGDLDLVLVGPLGVWSFEVKAFSGEYRNVGDEWKKRYGEKWVAAESPTTQSRRNAKALQQLLQSRQINIKWVEPVIIWADPESTIEFDNPSTYVWTLDRLSHHLQNLSDRNALAKGQVQKIVKALEKIHRDMDDQID